MDLITEATKNNFLVFLMDSRTPKLQKEIVIEYLKQKNESVVNDHKKVFLKISRKMGIGVYSFLFVKKREKFR